MNRASRLLRSVRRRWRVLTLACQYLLAGALVLVAGMTAIGLWVTDQIAQGVTQNTATATALDVDGVLAPLLPDIDGLSVLSAGARRALDETLATGRSASGSKPSSSGVRAGSSPSATTSVRSDAASSRRGARVWPGAGPLRPSSTISTTTRTQASARRACRFRRSTIRSASRGPDGSWRWRNLRACRGAGGDA